MKTQKEKAEVFRKLHERDRVFLIPNPWDIGTTRLLEKMGFEALATTSAGFAFSIGRLDDTAEQGEMMEHLVAISSATDLPVSADLGKGFGDSPEIAAESIRLAANAGVVGGSIEDATARPEDPIYEIEFAVERVRAAVEAARALPFPFTLTARAENYLHGRPDLKDTIKRLQLFQSAGADVLYAPGLVSKEDIATVVKSVDRPVNVVMGLKGSPLRVNELAQLGVRRISVGSALSRAAYGAFLRAAQEIKEHGTFTFSEQAVSMSEISRLLKE
jgi:2-methylisocitrate lyase-like PEP mutase family enzyme